MWLLIAALSAAKMPYLYEQPGWPNFSWDAEELQHPLGEVRHKLGRLLGRMEHVGFPLQRETSLQVLMSDVLKSSAIEGELLNHGEVQSSIVRRLGLDVAGLPKAARDVEGVVEMMLDASLRFAEPLTAERLCGWYASLFPTGRSGMSRITVGSFRTVEAGPMQVVSGNMWREQVHFVAPPAEQLAREMGQFVAWVEHPGAIDPVLVAGVAHLWFLTLHPFDDGNGRIARAIADLLLARADGTKDRYYSLST
jgi:Fic family protein